MHPALRLGVLAAGFNSGMLLVNIGFTNSKAVATLNPEMFSPFGQLMVLVWGAAYLAAGYSRAEGPIWYVFAIEKLAYVVGWIKWHMSHNALAFVMDAYHEVNVPGHKTSLLAAIFHMGYGVGDAIFAIAFAYHAMTQSGKHD